MQLVSNRYELLDLLGRGTTSEVYRARDRVSDRMLALKWSVIEDATARAMFRQEYWALRRLSHRGLPQAFDLGCWEGRDYFTMELVQGEAIPTLATFDASRLQLYLTQLAEILGYLHAQGLCHGDLKPENLRATESDRLVLLDLGFLQPAGRQGQGQGTLEYMAPEVILRAPVDTRSDLYALGVMAYQWLNGRSPFAATDPLSLLHAQLEMAPLPFGELAQDLPGTLPAAVLSLLEKEAAQRPPTVGHFLQRLGWGAAGGYLVFGGEIFGRDPERAAIRIGLADQVQGVGAALRISGPAGAGKSRLLHEAASVWGNKPLLAVSGRGEAPYGLVVSLLESCEPLLAEQHLPQDADDWLALCALMPDWGTAPPPLEPKSQESRLRQALFKLLTALSQGVGLLIIIDDWDESDAASRALMAPLLLRGTSPRLAWVIAQEEPATGEGAVPLEPLGLEAVTGFLRLALAEEPEPVLCKLAHDRSLGNPALLRSLLRHWHERKALRHEFAHWVFDFHMAEELTFGAEQVLVEGVKALSPAAMRLGKAGAVIGQEFHLAQATALTNAECLDALGELVQAELLDVRGARCRFLGAARAFFLSALQPEEASSLHELAAELYRGRTDLTSLTQAARHVLRARMRGESELVLRAAEANLAQGALRVVEELCEGCLALTREDSARELALRLQADALRTRGEAKPALEAYQQAIALARTFADRTPLCRGLASAGRAKLVISAFADARAFSLEALQLSREIEDPGQAARCLMTLGRADYFEGRLSQAQGSCEEALAIAAAIGDEPQKALALGFLGLMAPPADPLGRERLQQAIDLNRRLQNPVGLIDALINLGDRRMAAGDLRGAEPVLVEGLEACQSIGSANEEVFLLLNLAQVRLEAGAATQALQTATAAAELADSLKLEFPAGYAHVLRGLACLKLAAYDSARSAFDRASDLAASTRNPILELSLRLALAWKGLEFGEWEQSLEDADAAAGMAASAQDDLAQVKARYCSAMGLLLMGRCSQAQAALEEAAHQAESAGGLLARAMLRYARGRLALLQGSALDALSMFEQVIKEATDLGALDLAAEAHRLACDAAFDLERPDEALRHVERALDFAEEAQHPLLRAHALLSKARVAQGAVRREARQEGETLVRRLGHEAQAAGFFRWPEREFRRSPKGTEEHHAIEAADWLGFFADMRRAPSRQALLERLLLRAVRMTQAQAGAILTYRNVQLDAYAVHELPEEAIDTLPLVINAYWERVPLLEAERWAIPLLEEEELLGILFLTGPELRGQALVPDLKEALAGVIGTFTQWTSIQESIERLTFSDFLAKEALAHPEAAPMQRILQEALRATGASRALVIRPAEGGFELVLGVDAQGRSVQPQASFSRSVCLQVQETKQAIKLLDAQNMDKWQAQQSILALELRTILAVPITWQEEALGILYLDSSSMVARIGSREENVIEASASVLACLLAAGTL